MKKTKINNQGKRTRRGAEGRGGGGVGWRPHKRRGGEERLKGQEREGRELGDKWQHSSEGRKEGMRDGGKAGEWFCLELLSIDPRPPPPPPSSHRLFLLLLHLLLACLSCC